jgi:hypothetical protein
MKKLLLFLFLFTALRTLAQDASLPDTATVVVHKDPRADALVKKQAAMNAAIRRANARTARGYRLLVVNTSNRNEAIEAKTKVYTYFPELKSYLGYQTPYFKLKAGNFRTRAEAEKYLSNFKTIFPKGVFIVNDTIEVKPEKETDN